LRNLWPPRAVTLIEAIIYSTQLRLSQRGKAMTALSISMAAECAKIAGTISSGHARMGPWYQPNIALNHNVGKNTHFGDLNLDDIGAAIRTAVPITAAPAAPRPPNPIGFDGTNAFVFCGSTSLTGYKPYGMVMPGERNRPDEALITFRGSSHTSDYILTDVAMAPGVSPQGFLVHGGFAKVFETCKDEIDRALAQLHRIRGRNIRTLHICGHSMGGALATLCAEHFINSGYTIYLYTFGAPRVGMRDHAHFMWQNLGANLFRYYYPNDWITWLPIMPYWHMPGTLLTPKYGSGFIPRGVHGDYFDPGVQNIERQATGTAFIPHDLQEEVKQLFSKNPSGFRCVRAMKIAIKVINLIIRSVGGVILFAGATVVDQVAHLLFNFGMKNSISKTLITSLITYMMRILGKPFYSVGKCIKSFLGWLLELFMKMVRGNARESIQDMRTGKVILHFD
jgi:hypothetical protein